MERKKKWAPWTQGVALLGVWSCWSRYAPVGGSVSQGVGFEVSKAQAKPSGSLSLPASCQSECGTLSYHFSTMSVLLQTMLLTMTIMDKASAIKFFLIRVAVVRVSLHSERNPN